MDLKQIHFNNIKYCFEIFHGNEVKVESISFQLFNSSSKFDLITFTYIFKTDKIGANSVM